MIRRFQALVLAWAVLAFSGIAGQALAAPTFPPLTGRVVDQANLLSPQVEADLSAKLEALEKTTRHQVVVVTLPDLQGYEISDFGYQLGRAWQIGRKGEDDGALFIVVPSERKVRIEVGYGLEGVLTDALSNVILQREVLPRFKGGDMEGGVVAGTDALIQQLAADPEAAAQALKAANTASAKSSHSNDPMTLVLVLLFILWVIGNVFGRRRGGLGALLPWIILSGGGFSGGGRDGGGGGGFGGGGGSFGGGGSSGSW